MLAEPEQTRTSRIQPSCPACLIENLAGRQLGEGVLILADELRECFSHDRQPIARAWRGLLRGAWRCGGCRLWCCSHQSPSRHLDATPRPGRSWRAGAGRVTIAKEVVGR